MGIKLNINGDHYNKESIGPFRTYHLSRGLTLEFGPTDAIVRGGRNSNIRFPQTGTLQESGLFPPKDYSQILDLVEHDIGTVLVGANRGASGEVMFRLDESVITGDWLAEELFGRVLALESLTRKRVVDSYSLGKDDLQNSREYCANIHDLIEAGRLGPSGLSILIEELKNLGTPIGEAFLVYNAQSIADDLRYSILSACHDFAEMTFRIWRVNESHRESPYSGMGLAQGQEILHSSGEAERISFAFTSAIVACYTSLDLLYELFVYLTREPFGNPEFPKNLHFPSAASSPIFRNGGKPQKDDPPATTLPFAIPNLDASHFGSLRRTRNDLVHSMASDALRPRVRIGLGLPPVNNQPLQYVQYLMKDIDAYGKPVVHPWARRFYETQSDAQESLYNWLILTWQCIFDTVEWLIRRLTREAEVNPR